ncbi:capping protein-inhibiting regulator of actin dynamics isoform X4 [Tachysurus fulvidraco]|uniref:capping protein-inhibiting regulator of actin dynamics isoform X4 n=1 Tax=Tachysurus fulvidraco TaxID=1234273 RepID=UPI001FEE199C|nr:capping protein-inhibiting regulator of actin dynamics isoform X4 [Tachysurus fulvidraco]
MATFYSCLRGKNDCDIMASGSADAPAAPESSDAPEECPGGKKKSKFQTFKNFFAKKKKKEATGLVAESEVQLKSSQSIEDVNIPEPTSIQTDKDSDCSSNINVESKALSKDSVFTSDPPSPETNEALQSSQDSIHGKVKSLQMQLKQAIRLGSPPAVISMKKSEDGGVVSEDDGLPCSPPEYSTVHTVLPTSSQRSSGVVQRSGSLSLEGSDSDDDQMSGASSRPGTPQTSIPVDFSEPASSLSCLDCSAAHHRIAVKSRACAKRKPASREMLQPKKRDLRERVLLRDTEDKLRAARTSTGEEENQDEEEINEVQHDFPLSTSVLAEDEEDLLKDLPASSQRSSTTTSGSVEAFDDDECVPDKDQVTSSGILESSWENPVTLELQTDDFLLDGGCEVVTKEQGSLLEEVLSSLRGPLVSGLVLESVATTEQMEVKDTAGKDVLVNLDADSATEHPDSTDPLSVLDDQLPVENTLSESVTLLQEAEYVVQEEEVPEEQEFAEEVHSEEDQRLHEGRIEKEEYEVEEDQDNGKDLKEEVPEDQEITPCAVEEAVMEQEDGDTEMEENMDEEEKQENEEDATKEADQEEEILIEDNKSEKDVEELNKEEKDDDDDDDDEIKDQSYPLGDEEQELKLDTSIEIESFHETDEGSILALTEVVNQPEDLIAQKCIEQPPFVVMTSLELSFPKKPSPQPKETEHVLEILQHDILEQCEDQSTESLQIANEHFEEVHQGDVLSGSHQSSTSESTVAKESIQELSYSEADDEPIFNKPLSRDQSSVSMTAEQSASQDETPSLPSSPLQREISQADKDTTPENPFGVRLRKTPVLHRYGSEGETPTPNTEHVETPKSPFLEQLSRKPILSKKPDQVADGVGKPKRSSDPPGKASVESSESPIWISLARQKQKVFKENSLDESLGETKVLTQEESDTKGLLDDLPGPVTKDQLKPATSPVKVSCSLEISKPVLVEKEKRSISHTVPAPLTQDEPPWLALAKKKAKAWSEMPQIVQ